MTKRDPFLQGLRRKREAANASSAATGKPLEQMSLEELEAEERRLQWETTKADIERMAEKQRAAQTGASSTGPRAFVPRKQTFSFPRRGRPYWK